VLELALREAANLDSIAVKGFTLPLASRQQAACEKLEQAPALQICRVPTHYSIG
jgi:hypothetical protein